MNYYEHHLGDYMRDTAHLSMLEDGAYRRLMDAYYIKEAPIPTELRDACRLARAQAKQEREAVEIVLKEFFSLEPDGWHHKRCAAEIARYQDKQAKAKRSADARWSAHRSDSEGNADAYADGMRTHSDGNAHQTPDTSLQSPKKTITSTAKLPTCPHLAIVDLYHEVLPELPAVRLMPEKRKKAIAKTWAWVLTSTKPGGERRAETAEQAINWLRDYFGRARDNDFLMGRTPRGGEHSNWQCDLDFLLTDKGMTQVIEKTREAHA